MLIPRKISTRKARAIRAGVISANNYLYTGDILVNHLVGEKGTAAMPFVANVLKMVGHGIEATASSRLARKVFREAVQRGVIRDIRSAVTRYNESVIDDTIRRIMDEAD